MNEEQNKLEEMFKKALANRASKESEEQNKKEASEHEQDENNDRIELEQSINQSEQTKTVENFNEEFENDKLGEELIEEIEDELDESPEENEEDNENENLTNSNETSKSKFKKIIKVERENSDAVMISIDKLEDYPNQPFKMYSEDKEKEMIDSIKVNGVIQDLIVRPLPNGKYQILSGHNRKNCAIKAGLTELPCKIKDVDDDTAKLMLVDTNLVQRKDFYPSETAKALKIKRDIYRKKEVKSDFFDEIQKEQNMSRGNIQRYLRLNFLIPELLDKVDTKEINLKNAEDISFLTQEEQRKLEQMLEAKPRKLTTNQAKKLREESDKNNLTERTLKTILENDEKEENKDIEIKFTKDEIDKYFRDFKSIKEIKEFIISIFEDLLYKSDNNKNEEVNSDG